MTLVISKGLTLDNGTRAAAIAGVSPTLDYRFAREKREIETVSLTDKLTYTGGNGTFVGSDGFIQRATTNVPRFDHDPLSRRSLGLLSEASGENLYVTSSFIFGSPANGTLTTAVQPSPFSAVATVQKFALNIGANTGNNTDGLGFASTPVANETLHTQSMYVKMDGATTVRLRSNVNGSLFDIVPASGAPAPSGSVTACSVEPFADGWYRVSWSYVTTSSVPGNRMDYWRIKSEIADGTSGYFCTGFQINPGALTGFIPTSGTAVTRTADSAVIDGTGVLTGTYTMVEKPAGCAVVSGTNINLQPGFTAERVMVFPAALDAGQITAIRGAM